jgi:putative ABC transport system permease protein
METIWNDLKYGWRMLRRNPGFAVVAVLTLAIGIGANAAIFSVINTILLRQMPFKDPSRIIIVWDTDPNRALNSGTISAAEFLDWRDMNKSFAELDGLRPSFVTLTGNGDAKQVWGVQVSTGFFGMLGLRPAVGRDFRPEEGVPGHEQVALISYSLWQGRFGGDPTVLDKSILVDYKPYTVIGVLPKNFSMFGTSTSLDVWLPFAFNRAQLNREDHQLIVLGRLHEGVTVPQAQAEMETIQANLKKQYPTVDQENGIRVAGFQSDLAAGIQNELLIIMAAVGFVLLIACANVANLMLARAASREREIALRSTLGAGHRRILRQLLTESILLALIGGAFGVLVAFGGLRLLHHALPPPGLGGEIPHSADIGIDWHVLAYTFVVSLLTGIIFGLAPALQISRSHLSESLKESTRGSTSGRRNQLARSGLIVSEVALSLMLLIGAGLLLRSFFIMLNQDLGFNPSHVLTMQVWLPGNRYPDEAKVADFYEQATDRIAQLPGVEVAGASNYLPLTRWTAFCNFDITDRTPAQADHPFTSEYRVIDWRYFQAMHTPVKEGRGFLVSDGPGTQPIAVINQALRQRYWPDQDPVGQQIRIHRQDPVPDWEADKRSDWLTIVGVVANTQGWNWEQKQPPLLYLPYVQNPSRMMHFVIRSHGDEDGLAAGVRHVIASIDRDQPVTEVHSMDDFLISTLSQRRLSMVLLAIFAGVATVLAAIGIYGVMAYAVTQRLHEIGIRMALGANPSDVLRMVVGDGMRLAGLGFAIGLAASLFLMRYLRSQLYGVKSFDPVTFVCVVAGLALVALAACYFPARRATRVDPLDALRHE